MENLEQQILTQIQKLYPSLTEMEARQAGHNMRQYFEIVVEIQSDDSNLATGGIDNLRKGSTMKERSKLLKS
jgi:hypothetical protein